MSIKYTKMNIHSFNSTECQFITRIVRCRFEYEISVEHHQYYQPNVNETIERFIAPPLVNV